MYHPEGIACPSPCNRATNFTFLWKGWIISRWKKSFDSRGNFFLGGGGGGARWGGLSVFWLLSTISFT